MSKVNDAKDEMEVFDAYWQDIKAHLTRDALIVVSRELDINYAAAAVAKDDTESVTAWISGGQMAKPTMDQIKEWEKKNSKPFVCVIIQPYVLIKETLEH